LPQRRRQRRRVPLQSRTRIDQHACEC
jgi:hypothetical protein